MHQRGLLLFALPLCACAAKAELPAAPPTTSPTATPPTAALVEPAGSPTSPLVGTSLPMLTGTTEPHRRATMAARVGGVVAKVHVREGDRVRAGQALVALDGEDFALRVAQATAGLDGAKAAYDATALEWERIKKLRADKAVPESQADLLNAKYEGAKAQLAAAEAMAAMARKAARDAVLTAPFAGLVTRRFVNEGEFATAMPPTMLVTLEETDPLDLRISLPATEMQRVAVGDRVEIRFAGRDDKLTASIARLVTAMDARTRTFAAIVELPNASHALWSGMFAEVRLLPADQGQPKAQAAAEPQP